MALTPCSHCLRHVRAADPACPFCNAARTAHGAHRTLAHGVATVVLASALASCGGSPPVTEHPESKSDGKPGPLVQEPPSPAPAPSPDDRTAPAYGGPPAPPGPATSGPAAPPGKGGTVEIAAPVVKGKLASDESVERVIRATENGLKACYERGLQSDPDAGGVVEFRINVTDSGVIKRVESSNPSTMPGSVTACMVGRFGAMSFNAAGASTIDVKVTCRRGE